MDTESSFPEQGINGLVCVVCEQIPDYSPVYRCHNGHYICNNCFEKFLFPDVPTCIACTSRIFVRQTMSNDILNRLKHKLIPRESRNPPNPPNPLKNFEEKEEECMGRPSTLEEIFQLPCDILDKIFEKNNHRLIPVESMRNIGDVRISASRSSVKVNPSNMNLFRSFDQPSRKPIKCPHTACNKTVAISSVKSHYKFDHSDLKRHYVLKGKSVLMGLNLSTLHQGKTTCLGIIDIYEIDTRREIDYGTFWIMVSDVPGPDFDSSYVLFWVFTNNNAEYICTMELITADENTSLTAQCAVNRIQESQNIMDISERMACLFATYGAIKSMRNGIDIEITIN